MVFVVSGISAPAAPLGPEYPGARRHPGARNLTDLPATAPRLPAKATAPAAPFGPEYLGARRTPNPRRSQPRGLASKSPGNSTRRALRARIPRPRHPQPYGLASKSPGNNTRRAPRARTTLGPRQKQQHPGARRHPRPRRTTSVPALAPRTEWHVINYK